MVIKAWLFVTREQRLKVQGARAAADRRPQSGLDIPRHDTSVWYCSVAKKWWLLCITARK